MAIQKKTEGRDLEEYLQEVWDSLEPAWDKSKFDMKQGYDSEYECDCITITSKDNEGVRAKIYVNDYEGRHPVGFDVVYRYPGDKGVGVMGSYEFQSTDMDNLGEEVFDYFDEIKQKAAGAVKEGESFAAVEDSMNAIEKFAKEHGAEYEDEKTLAPLFKEAVQSVIGDKGAVEMAWTYTKSNDVGYVDWEASITGMDGMLPEDEIVLVLSTFLDDGAHWLMGRYMDEFDTIAEAYSDEGSYDPFPILNYLLAEVKKDRSTSESKKFESLTLKQKELKDMARFGQAEDITTISDEEAKALRKKGIETIGISRGTYGMNGALLRDNEGKKYVITARSSNLFYFV